MEKFNWILIVSPISQATHPHNANQEDKIYDENNTCRYLNEPIDI